MNLEKTDRELHACQLIGTGLGTGRIAQGLGLSRKTIETYREHIKLKLGYGNGQALSKGAAQDSAQAKKRPVFNKARPDEFNSSESGFDEERRIKEKNNEDY